MLDSFYFTVIGTSLANYCKIEITRYWPNATVNIDYKDGTAETIRLIGATRGSIGYLAQNDLNITEYANQSISLIRLKYDFNRLSNSVGFSYQNSYKDTFYLSGILFQHIQFDDNYWLNGFEFEALNDGWIKLGVFVLSNYLIYCFKLLLKYNSKDC